MIGTKLLFSHGEGLLEQRQGTAELAGLDAGKGEIAHGDNGGGVIGAELETRRRPSKSPPGAEGRGRPCRRRPGYSSPRFAVVIRVDG